MKNCILILSTVILSLFFDDCKKAETEGPADPSQSEVIIFSLSAMHAGGDSSLTITGTGFSEIPASNMVKVNGKIAVVNSATSTKLTITIPKRAGDGNISVTMQQKTGIKSGFIYDWVAYVSTFAGGPTDNSASIDGTGLSATFNAPLGIAIDTNTGNMYVAEYFNAVIRKVNVGAVVSTLTPNYYISGASGICRDATGNLFVTSEGDNVIYKISPQGIVSLFAGHSNGEAGSDNGNGSSASFKWPYGICIDVSDNLYVADKGNHLIRKITPNGDVTTVAGIAGREGHSDGNASSARFSYPSDLCITASGVLFVTEWGNNTIRKITLQGEVSTFAGNATVTHGFADGMGTVARFFAPEGITIDKFENLYVTDYGNRHIRKITPGKMVTTIAGNGEYATSDGIGTAAKFAGPSRAVVDKNGDLYVTDEDMNNIRKISFQ